MTGICDLGIVIPSNVTQNAWVRANRAHTCKNGNTQKGYISALFVEVHNEGKVHVGIAFKSARLIK